ncbi:MAG: hypothetical protein MUO52_03305 [Desulfobacterales bacterium]|nr:hypothetical protein [Desulfobacterales bacterium]
MQTAAEAVARGTADLGMLARKGINKLPGMDGVLDEEPFMAAKAEDGEVMQFIENYRLMGKGLGYIDVHLLTSAMLSHVPLWTLDKKVNQISPKLGVAYGE